MTNVFAVKGLNPASGHVVDVTLVAESADEAKRQAEACGLRCVMVTAGTADSRWERSDRAAKI